MRINSANDVRRSVAIVGQDGSAPRQNRLLAALPAAVLNRLLPSLKLVKLSHGKVLFDRDRDVRQIHFPNDAVVSLSNSIGNGASIELFLVGVEGLVGTSVFMGGRSASRAVVQAPGTAYQISAAALMKEFNRHEDFLGLILRYMQSLITQTGQSAVCNRHHSIDQQLCRWLLSFLDRVPSNHLTLTHELIAQMLGVRREGVTTAALNLQKRGVIEYRRGHITVTNRSELEARSCECYAVVVKENTRLLPECAADLPGLSRTRDLSASRIR